MYEVRNIEEGVPEIFIYDEIDSFWGIGAAQVIKDLNSLGTRETITVRLSSPGGDSIEGFNIMNALIRNPAKIQISIDGQALSAASTIAMAGDTIAMAENALFMIHEPWTHAVGNAKEFRDRAATLDLVSDNIAKAYVSGNRKGKEHDEIKAAMEGEVDGTWYSATEALEFGFIDEITENLKIAAHFDPDKFTAGSIPDQFLARNNQDTARADQANSRYDRMMSIDV